MGMGSYQRRPRYQQENAMGNANVLAQLLQQKGTALDEVTGAVDEYGQSRVRNDVSELMGTDAFMKMNPAEGQAAIAAKTGGRDLGENFAKTLLMSDRNKGDVQGNTWKEDAATKLFGRQNAQIDKRHANATALSGMNNKARQKLYGNTVAGASGSNTDQLKQIGINVSHLEKAYANADSPQAKEAIKLEMKNQRIDAENLVKPARGYSAGAQSGIVGSLFDGGQLGQSTGKPAKVTNATVPKDLKIGLNSGQTDGLQRGINSGQLVVLPYESKPDTNGKTYRRYKVTDSMGNPVSKNQYSRF